MIILFIQCICANGVLAQAAYLQQSFELTYLAATERIKKAAVSQYLEHPVLTILNHTMAGSNSNNFPKGKVLLAQRCTEQRSL